MDNFKKRLYAVDYATSNVILMYDSNFKFLLLNVASPSTFKVKLMYNNLLLLNNIHDVYHHNISFYYAGR